MRLQHGRIELALHVLRDGGGPRLLCLHELGGESPECLPPELAAWVGSVYALDFAGHGESELPCGGGYTAEILMADADTALAALGEVTLRGRGLGAYVAMLLAGSRPRRVRGTILCDGEGLSGGGERGATPDLSLGPLAATRPDPYALHELSVDARPAGYVQLFARQAAALAPVPDPVTVVAEQRPPWLAGLIDGPGVVTATLGEALDRYGSFVADACLGS